jgi:hypothetical protein
VRTLEQRFPLIPGGHVARQFPQFSTWDIPGRRIARRSVRADPCLISN